MSHEKSFLFLPLDSTACRACVFDWHEAGFACQLCGYCSRDDKFSSSLLLHWLEKLSRLSLGFSWKGQRSTAGGQGGIHFIPWNEGGIQEVDSIRDRDKISKYHWVFSQIKHLSNVLGHLKTHRKACKKQFVSSMNKPQNILEQKLTALLANVRPLVKQESISLPAQSTSQSSSVLWSVEAILGTGDSPELWDWSYQQGLFVLFSSDPVILEQAVLPKKFVGAISAGRIACVSKDACLASAGLKSPVKSAQTLEQL